MSQLNELDNEAILYLRNMKVLMVKYSHDKGHRCYHSEQQVWRFYLEACPHGK